MSRILSSHTQEKGWFLNPLALWSTRKKRTFLFQITYQKTSNRCLEWTALRTAAMEEGSTWEVLFKKKELISTLPTTTLAKFVKDRSPYLTMILTMWERKLGFSKACYQIKTSTKNWTRSCLEWLRINSYSNLRSKPNEERSINRSKILEKTVMSLKLLICLTLWPSPGKESKKYNFGQASNWKAQPLF